MCSCCHGSDRVTTEYTLHDPSLPQTWLILEETPTYTSAFLSPSSKIHFLGHTPHAPASLGGGQFSILHPQGWDLAMSRTHCGSHRLSAFCPKPLVSAE